MAKEKRIFPTIIKIVFLALFVCLMCWFTMKDNYQEVLVQLSNISLLDLCFLILISSLLYVISGIIVTLLAKKHQSSYRFQDGICLSFITIFTSNVLFSATSKLVQYYLFYVRKIKMDVSTCIIALEFLSYQILMMMTSLLMMTCYHSYFLDVLPNELPLAWFGTLISFLPLIGLSLLLWYPPMQSLIRKSLIVCVSFFHLKLDVIALDENVGSFMHCLNSLKDAYLQDRKLMIQLFVWNLLRHIVKHCVPIVIALMLHLPLDFALIWLLFLYSMFLDLWLTAIPIAGKHGFAEAGFATIFSVLVGDVTASSMMLLWRFVTFYASTLMGGLWLMFNQDVSLQKLRELAKQKK